METKIHNMVQSDAQLMLAKQNSFESLEYLNMEDRFNQKMEDFNKRLVRLEEQQISELNIDVKDVLRRLLVLEGQSSTAEIHIEESGVALTKDNTVARAQSSVQTIEELKA